MSVLVVYSTSLGNKNKACERMRWESSQVCFSFSVDAKTSAPFRKSVRAIRNETLAALVAKGVLNGASEEERLKWCEKSSWFLFFFPLKERVVAGKSFCCVFVLMKTQLKGPQDKKKRKSMTESINSELLKNNKTQRNTEGSVSGSRVMDENITLSRGSRCCCDDDYV